MNGPAFDPFRNRLARKVRNGLSRALMRSLQSMTAQPVREEAEQLLRLDLAEAHHAYLEDRMRRYERVLERVREDRVTDPLLQSVFLWNEKLFFEVHERLEILWRPASSGYRKAIQGLILASGTYVHLERGNIPGARSAASKASDLLLTHGRELPLKLNLDDLVAALRELAPEPPPLIVKTDAA